LLYIVKRSPVKYWKESCYYNGTVKYIRRTAFCKASLQKQTVLSSLGKTSNRFIRMEGRIPFQSKILWNLWWIKRHCNKFTRVLSFSHSVSLLQCPTLTFHQRSTLTFHQSYTLTFHQCSTLTFHHCSTLIFHQG